MTARWKTQSEEETNQASKIKNGNINEHRPCARDVISRMTASPRQTRIHGKKKLLSNTTTNSSKPLANPALNFFYKHDTDPIPGLC